MVHSMVAKTVVHILFIVFLLDSIYTLLYRRTKGLFVIGGKWMKDKEMMKRFLECIFSLFIAV